MAETSLSKKLGIRPGFKLLVLNAPAGYLSSLEPIPDGAEIKTTAAGTFDFVQLFVRNKAELDSQAASAIKALKPGGLLWFSFPKKSSKVQTDLTRDIGWDSVRSTGLDTVTAISIDDTWSALRFRPANEVKLRQKT